jgi:transcriptional regulator with XRE-family HTH domain
MGANKPVRPGLQRRIGEVSREARHRLGLTQEDVAEKVGVATEVYGRLERGHMLPSLTTLVGLCRALRVTPNDLTGLGKGSSLEEYKALVGEEEEETPELRRLQRVARKLSPNLLRALSRMANALAHETEEREYSG